MPVEILPAKNNRDVAHKVTLSQSAIDIADDYLPLLTDQESPGPQGAPPRAILNLVAPLSQAQLGEQGRVRGSLVEEPVHPQRTLMPLDALDPNLEHGGGQSVELAVEGGGPEGLGVCCPDHQHVVDWATRAPVVEGHAARLHAVPHLF